MSLRNLLPKISLIFGVLHSCMTTSVNLQKQQPQITKQIETLCALKPKIGVLEGDIRGTNLSRMPFEAAWKDDFKTLHFDFVSPLGNVIESFLISQNGWESDSVPAQSEIKETLDALALVGPQGIRNILCGGLFLNPLLETKQGKLIFQEPIIITNPRTLTVTGQLAAQSYFFFSQDVASVSWGASLEDGVLTPKILRVETEDAVPHYLELFIDSYK